jgi:hypothetical protein
MPPGRVRVPDLVAWVRHVGVRRVGVSLWRVGVRSMAVRRMPVRGSHVVLLPQLHSSSRRACSALHSLSSMSQSERFKVEESVV